MSNAMDETIEETMRELTAAESRLVGGAQTVAPVRPPVILLPLFLSDPLSEMID
jgi:hypothetical protein